MIKLISKSNPDILAFRVVGELEKDDNQWMFDRINKRFDKLNHDVKLYIEFESFGELTLDRMWDHFKMLVSHLGTLIKKVDKVAVVTANENLRTKLGVEFALIPTIDFKSFDSEGDGDAITWLSNLNQTDRQPA